MIGEDTRELLSRFVDDDLSPSEAASLRRRMQQEPTMRRELDELQETRRAVRLLATRDQPPDLLDDLVVELRRQGRPSPRNLVVPLLAAAALVVMCFTLVLEMNRQDHPTELVTGRAVATPGVFALSALPEATGDAPLGPLEELLARPYPPPALLEAEPLIVVGPLPEPPPR